MSENVDAVENDAVSSSSSVCKQQKLSAVCQFDTDLLIDGTSDVVTSTSALLSDVAIGHMHQTIQLLPNLGARSVAGIFLHYFFLHYIVVLVLFE